MNVLNIMCIQESKKKHPPGAGGAFSYQNRFKKA